MMQGELGEEYELVANLTGQPPPIPKSCDDDGKAKNTGGCTRDVRKKARAAKDHPAEESGEILCALIEIRKSSYYTAPARFIKLQADSNVLLEIGETVKTAFESKSSDEFLDTLPAGRLRDRIYSLTGQTGKQRIKLDHLDGDELVFDIVYRKSLSVGSKDHILMEGIDHSTLVMRNNFDEQAYTGVQDASVGIRARDLLDIGNGKTLMSQSYRWQHQYVKDISAVDFKRLFYDQPLPFQAHDGTTIGDVLNIHTASYSGATSNQPNGHRRQPELLIFSGFSPTGGQDDIVLAGEVGDIPVRVGCGISFTFDQWHYETREMASGYGNPSQQACHGFVSAIAADGNDGSTVLSVRLVLGKGNLPPFFIWERISPHAVIQTNLQAVVPARCVVSTFLIKPVVLHCLATCLPESIPVFGAEAMPITRDVYVIGHFDFEQGDFQGQLEGESDSGQQDGRANGWQNRYADRATKAFALLADFCARGGPIIDGPFKELHGSWKKKYLDWTTSHQGGRYFPRVTLSSLPRFPVERALSTIDKCARLIAFTSFDASLVELRAAVCRFAVSKAKRATVGRQGGKIAFSPCIAGSLLLQLVHIYARQYTPVFREGAVEAVVDEFPSAEKLLDTKDGEFNLGEFGIVRFEAPITFRWVLYDAKKTDLAPSADGRAEVTFKKYVAKDRHGADLSGQLYGDEDQDGQGGKKQESEGGWNLQVKLR